MPDPRLTKLAEVLVNFSTRVKPGDWVHITAGQPALPLVREVVAAVLAAGGLPTTELNSNLLEEIFLARAGEEQLRWVSPLDTLMIEQVDVWIYIAAPENTRALSGIDPARQQQRQAAFKPWTEIYMQRSASGDLRWMYTNYPCQALAQDADMSLAEYEDFVYGATFVDQDDPVARWQEIHDRQARLVDWLAGKCQVEVRGPHADLRLSIAGRRFLNSFGDENMPSGEIYTSPLEDSAEGWVEFSYPAIYLGREVEGVRLRFAGGEVVEASAAKNEAFLLKMLDTDAGARRLGELGIGTNYGITRFTRDILFDEKIGGTFHLALGNSFGEAGGTNQSGIHWDLISDARQETTIRVDGELFYQDGEFVV